ncbi:endomucin [Elgaria multicarinata webbii]|uniref:endomucin n=1 Tax=Elgaria multicarinata webbii TaxID=159646 RepID=UPI002FCCFC20
MKLFGTALLSLALFSLCCVGAYESTTTSNTWKTTGFSTKGESSTTSTGTVFSSSTRNKTTSEVVTIESATSSKTTVLPKTVATSKSLSTINDTVFPGRVESSTQVSVTSMSSLTLATAGPNDKTTGKPYSQKTTSGTLTINPTESEDENKTKNAAGQERKDDASYSGIILPVIIALIVITLTVFLLMALYRMCFRTTPERQENVTEQSPSDKENVKLISVKTTSPEIGEQSPQGKNKPRQHNDSSSHLGNKCV